MTKIASVVFRNYINRNGNNIIFLLYIHNSTSKTCIINI